ncbi:MAG: ThuA domain-containing protein [Chitinophagaceae bacterium]|nr:ThuA domain-containing protein [Chitinophagaceae bacterium]
MMRLKYILSCLAFLLYCGVYAQDKPLFKVLAFYTAKSDLAHISFVHEANPWFAAMASKYHFSYDSTNDWNRLNVNELAHYQVIVFLDTRPEAPAQRAAFQKYMEQGGAWMGFHFSAFALTPSAYNQDWDWYHDYFLGSGQYASNTWRPTTAVLRVENAKHPATRGLPALISAAPNEWYRWEKDLRSNPDIDILLAVDSTSFPLGTGPKPHEIWHSGYYPVVWTNKKFHMVYFNMGHNDMDYEGHTNRQLSSSFSSARQNQLIINALLWLGGVSK